MKPGTGELNSRVTINKYIFGQTANGGNIKALSEFFDRWAKLENINGSRYLDNLQLTYSKAFKITTRYEQSKQLTNSDEIVYDDLVYVIQSITQREEGRKSFNEIIAWTNNTKSNSGDPIYRVANILNFTGATGETTIQDNRLIGWESIIVFRNQQQYRPVLGTPAAKQVQYDKAAGTLTFNSAFDSSSNQVDVYLITKGTITSLGGEDDEWNQIQW